MRAPLDASRLHSFMEEMGRSTRGPGRIFLVGGATALLLGIREQTIDVDIKIDPEPAGVFEAIAVLKDRMSINVELAAPDQFMPALPGWRERSEFIARFGQIDFYHYDFYGQALAKILRGHRRDLEDVRALVHLGKVAPPRLQELFDSVEAEAIRYPAIDVADFRNRVREFLGGAQDE